jgi:hypothetical protein
MRLLGVRTVMKTKWLMEVGRGDDSYADEPI